MESCDNLWAADSDNDSQTFTWSYAGPGAFSVPDAANGNVQYPYTEGVLSGTNDNFGSGYSHTYTAGSDPAGGPDADNTTGWMDMVAWLQEGTHTFTFQTCDTYDACASSETTFFIADEPGAKQPNINIDHTGLKYAIITYSDNAWVDSDFPNDDCHGDTYQGAYPNYNTTKLTLYNGDNQIDSNNTDGTNGSSDTFTHIDETSMF